MKALLCLLLTFLVAQAALAQEAAALAPLPPDGFVTLDQITQEFTAQPDAALKKYDGMRVVVYGRIGQVGDPGDEEGDPLVVFLQRVSNPTPDVKCVFTAAGVPQGGNVNVENDGSQAEFFGRGRDGMIKSERAIDIVGQMVGIQGTFDNFVAGDIVLKNCKKLKDSAVEALLAKHGGAQP